MRRLQRSGRSDPDGLDPLARQRSAAEKRLEEVGRGTLGLATLRRRLLEKPMNRCETPISLPRPQAGV